MKTTLREQLQLNLTNDQWKLLEFALQDASAYQQQLGDLYSPGIGFTAFIDELTRMKNAFIKLQEKRGTPEAAHRTIKRTLSNIPDRALLEISLFMPGVYWDSEGKFKAAALSVASGDHSQLDKATQAATDALNDFKQVGKGGARKDARIYIPGIQKLAQHFNEILPGYNISPAPDSYFFKFVMYWLEYEIGVYKEPDRRRHIQNAIEDFEQRKILF